MKRLLATALVLTLCLSVSVVSLKADPGDPTSGTTTGSESTWTNSQYGPPPPGYVGEWPPPDEYYTTDGTGSDSTATAEPTTSGDDTPWIDPDE